MLLLWSKAEARSSSPERRDAQNVTAACGQTAVNSGYRKWMIVLCYGKGSLPDLCVAPKQIIEGPQGIVFVIHLESGAGRWKRWKP
jgi:hypothetical protein